MKRRKLPQHSKPAGGVGAIAATIRMLRQEKAVVSGGFSLLKVNQPDGFDCPGCAWPEPPKGQGSPFEFCENGAKAVAAETTSKKITAAFFQKHSIQDLLAQDDYWLEQQGRLTHPMMLDESGTHYVPVSWDAAFDLIGKSLKALPDPNHALFYTSGRTSNEAAFLYQLFARTFGTNNLPDCSNLCHESSGVGLGSAIGIGKGTVQLADFDVADAIFVIGQNPGTNHPRMLTTLQHAAHRGAEIVVINPLVERGLVSFTHPQDVLDTALNRGTDLATLYLRPKVGSDTALLKGMMKVLFEREVAYPGGILDHEFIQDETHGFEELKTDIESTSWDDIVQETGVSREEIEAATEIYIQSKASIICWAMGITQHTNGVDNVQSIANLLLLKGNMGRPGAGACPVRGHSNVQGDRTVGIVERPKEAFLARLDEVFNIRSPREHGASAVAAIEAMRDTKDMVFVGMGGNFVMASPDTDLTFEAMKNCALTVHVSTKLNRSHLIHGKQALILPCLARSEVDQQASGPQRVTVEDSMGCVHASQGHRTPPSEALKSEPAIIAGMAHATVGSETIPWHSFVEDYARIRGKIEEVIPLFEGYEEKLEQPGGFLLRNSAAHRDWKTPSSRAQFHVVPTPKIEIPDGALRLFTIRSHDQYNTTIYGMDDRYRGIVNERRVLFMNPEDMASRNLSDGDRVDIIGPDDDGRTRRVEDFRVVAYDVVEECCAAYLPEANPLMPVWRKAAKSHTPASKLVPVRVVKRGEGVEESG